MRTSAVIATAILVPAAFLAFVYWASWQMLGWPGVAIASIVPALWFAVWLPHRAAALGDAHLRGTR